jgi:hypothetical protein
MNSTTIAVDVAKAVFEIAVSEHPGQVRERHRFSRERFRRYLGEQPPAAILMEACGSAHYWGRQAQAYGHRVVLLPPHVVRPYVLRNKTDRTDAKGLLEAARNDEACPVPVKSESQQAVAALHPIARMGAGIEDAPDLLAAETVGPLLGLLGGGNVEVGARAAERDVVEKPEGVGGLGTRAPGPLSSLEEIRKIRLDLVSGELVGGPTIVAGQPDHLSDRGLVGTRGESSDRHVAEHSCAQLTHGPPPLKNLGRR